MTSLRKRPLLSDSFSISRFSSSRNIALPSGDFAFIPRALRMGRMFLLASLARRRMSPLVVRSSIESLVSPISCLRYFLTRPATLASTLLCRIVFPAVQSTTWPISCASTLRRRIMSLSSHTNESTVFP